MITDSTDIVTSEISSSKSINNDSQATVVDPDNGETSTVSQNEAESNMKSDSDTVEVKDSNIPSPSSTVEVVISDAGLQTFFINTEDSGKILLLNVSSNNCIKFSVLSIIDCT